MKGDRYRIEKYERLGQVWYLVTWRMAGAVGFPFTKHSGPFCSEIEARAAVEQAEAETKVTTVYETPE